MERTVEVFVFFDEGLIGIYCLLKRVVLVTSGRVAVVCRHARDRSRLQ